ncbi:MAG: helix-hairpin-helix domain-containing protein [Minisyncoccia bacterium]
MRRNLDPTAHAAALRELRTIPGIGPSIAQDLVDLGITKVSELKGLDPEVLYRRFEKLVGTHVDRCLLYTFRCAVYYASNTSHDPRLLKWWNWKDRT